MESTNLSNAINRKTAKAKLDNDDDHRAETSDLPFQKHMQALFRAHRIVIHRLAVARDVSSTFQDCREFLW